MIGTEEGIRSKSLVIRILARMFGTLSLHMQLRLGAVYGYLHTYKHLKVLDLGSGGGMNALELKKIVENLDYTGVDITIDKAKKFETEDIKFYKDDCLHYLQTSRDKYDMIFLLDILEHIPYPKEVLRLCKEQLKDSGIILISVPTPNYPKIFGREWHEKIGHLVDGYTLEMMNELVGQKAVYHKYHTGLLAKVGCWISYNKLNLKNNYLNLLKQILVYPFKYTDFINNKKVSCSLFAVYKNKNII